MNFGENWWDVKNESEKFHQVFLNQLQQELPKGHLLHGLPVRMLAKCEVNDDVLFEILESTKPNSLNKVAQVHLTWKKGGEILPYPLTKIYDNLEQWQIILNKKLLFKNVKKPNPLLK